VRFYYVDIKRLDSDGNVHTFARFKLYEGDRIVVPEMIEVFSLDKLLYTDEKGSFIVGKNRKKYRLNQGLLFLDNLKYAFSGSRVRAGEIFESEG